MPVLEGNAENIQGKHLEIRKVCDNVVSENMRSSIREFCTVSCGLGEEWVGACLRDVHAADGHCAKQLAWLATCSTRVSLFLQILLHPTDSALPLLLTFNCSCWWRRSTSTMRLEAALWMMPHKHSTHATHTQLQQP
jgi:hypothetical protein